MKNQIFRLKKYNNYQEIPNQYKWDLDDILKAGLDKIIPSNSDLGDNSVEDEIYKAALNAYNDEEK